ncbi:peptidoglycan-binding protein [Clostridium tetani]
MGSYGADGYFGDATLNAIKSFQRDNGILVDGIVGRDTWERLAN